MVSMALSVMADCLIAVLIGLNLDQILQMLGASPITMDYCKIYAFWWLMVVFNGMAMTFVGEDGIAAVSIIMYLQFIFIGIYLGFSMGIAPPLGYVYGNNKHEITFFRSLAFLLLFLKVLPGCWGIRGIWLAVPVSEFLTLLILVGYMIFKGDCEIRQAHSQS